MKITVRKNDVNQNINVPISWDQVSFKQFLALSKPDPETKQVINTYSHVLSVFTGIDEGVIQRAQITGLDKAMQVLSFIKKPCHYLVPKRLLFYEIPKDLGFETIAQYEEMRDAINKVSSQDYYTQLEQYPLYCAVYACKQMSRPRVDELRERFPELAKELEYGAYHWKKAEVMAEEFLNCPAPEVLGVGNFTILKYVGLNLGINQTYHKPLTPLRRLTLVFKRWLLRLDLQGLFLTWKKKLVPVQRS
jgi:hypothetical protein